MTLVPGISGTLLPARYVLSRLLEDLTSMPTPAGQDQVERRRRQWVGWWRRAEAMCGPATGIRTIFDVFAMPLFGMLGFRARDAVFESGRARVRLETRSGTPLGLMVLPWAHRPSGSWRNAVVAAHEIGATWCFLAAPPHISLVDARGHASKRSVEFALPAALEPESFIRFWALCAERGFDRIAPAPVDSRRHRAAATGIEQIVDAGDRFQDHVRADLQNGVVAALTALEGLRRLPPAARHTTGLARDEALTVVFRILFLLFAESRRLVPRDHPVYERSYAVAALCREALTRERSAGLWDGLAAITRLSRHGCRTDDLIVRPFNGALFAREAAPLLETPARRSRGRFGAEDVAMRDALVALGTRPGDGGREDITYSDLGVEQLGAVYERVLDLEPPDVASVPAPRDVRARGRRAHSTLRKRTGTFYTPQPLAEFVVRRTLAPLVAGASSDAILALRVVDPAMGSGAFLVAACRFLADARERALLDEGRLAESDVDDHVRADLRRQVAERCLAGVDANPVAVQLARLSLWLATLSQGKPLGFLDHRLRVGNSLIGASPDDLTRTARHRQVPATSLPLFDAGGLEHALRRIAQPWSELVSRRDDDVAVVHAKSAIWRRLSGVDSPMSPWRRACDLWCARWFASDLRDLSPAELRAAIDALTRHDGTLGTRDLLRWLHAAETTRATQRFFHWPLEFPDVFYDPEGHASTSAGFDAVIGNPPWEMVRQDAADERTTHGGDPMLRFIRESGMYPSCGRGHLNLYQPFLERSVTICKAGGQVGLVLPWGLATDDGAAALRRMVLDRCTTSTMVGLDNSEGIFPIHRGLRFLALVTSPGGHTREVRSRFGIRSFGELDALPGRDHAVGSAYPVRLTPETIALVGGVSARIPDVRHPLDLTLARSLASRFPRLGDGAGCEARFGRELNATDDRDGFGREGLPVLEGKHLRAFGVDLDRATKWMTRAEALRRLPDARFERPRLAYRDVSGVGNRATLIAAVLPAHVVTTHTLFCLRTPARAIEQHYLCGLFNSHVLNAMVRLLMGSHVTTSLVEDLPVPPWAGTPEQHLIGRLAARLARLSIAPPDIAGQLQAAVARLYGLDTELLSHVLSAVPHLSAAERAATLHAAGVE